MTMNTFDASFHCSYCHERYEFCGCPNDEVDFADGSAVCGECNYIASGLFYFAGDNTGRCAYCHNGKRASYNTYAEPDWF